MKYRCGIELGARDSQIWVTDKQVKIVWEQKVRNDIERITKLLEPFKANLQIVVESTFNWYWLVDGLEAGGFDVVLAHTPGLHLITKAKVKTHRLHPFNLAKLLFARTIP